MKITIETLVHNDLDRVWQAWTTPDDIKQWNTASDAWHTTVSTVDLREGGRFLSRMEARDGSAGFDFEGIYTRIVPHRLIEYRLSDGRAVAVEFIARADGVLVSTAFEPEDANPVEMQRAGWQAILDNFGRHASRAA